MHSIYGTGNVKRQLILKIYHFSMLKSNFFSDSRVTKTDLELETFLLVLAASTGEMHLC